MVEPKGRVLHMTGQVAWDSDGNVIGKGDCEAQARQCFDNVENILKAVGGRLDDIVSLRPRVALRRQWGTYTLMVWL
ncbi:MAG: RidA family protein [Pelagimonas sp.]|jgi:enamine deaminase RidA (YjgF/YER057c/UK114 family)|nr:RidA family protein [Pelagimonas sp.]